MLSTLKQKKYLIIFLLFLILLPTNINAKNKLSDKNLVNIYFFHSKDCSHCNEELKFLANLEKKYPNIKIYKYEIHNQTNNQSRLKVMKKYNLKGSVVPLTIIGDTPYMGYKEELSNITFIKTIEYYAKYGYKDQVGEMLNIKELPTISITSNAPTLDHFLETYANYHLIGHLSTNDFTLSSNTTILAILSQLNPILIITAIIVALLAHKKDDKRELIYVMLYFLTDYLITTTFVASNYYYTTFLMVLTISTTIIFLLRKKYLISLTLIIATLTSILTNTIYSETLHIFKHLIFLHAPTSLTKLNHYTNYLITTLMTNIVYLLIYIIIIIKTSSPIKNA